MIKLLASLAGSAMLALAMPAAAQTPPATPDDLEPGVNTSAPDSAPPPAPASTPAPADDLEPGVNTSAPGNVPGAAPPADTADNRPTPPARRGGAQDRLDLESTQITGNRELPKVLYIVPWRGAELGDLVGRPVNSLLDEVLEPVDRDVFRRQNRYFEALQPGGTAPAGKPEK